MHEQCVCWRCWFVKCIYVRKEEECVIIFLRLHVKIFAQNSVRSWIGCMWKWLRQTYNANIDTNPSSWKLIFRLHPWFRYSLRTRKWWIMFGKWKMRIHFQCFGSSNDVYIDERRICINIRYAKHTKQLVKSFNETMIIIIWAHILCTNPSYKVRRVSRNWTVSKPKCHSNWIVCIAQAPSTAGAYTHTQGNESVFCAALSMCLNADDVAHFIS